MGIHLADGGARVQCVYRILGSRVGLGPARLLGIGRLWDSGVFTVTFYSRLRGGGSRRKRSRGHGCDEQGN